MSFYSRLVVKIAAIFLALVLCLLAMIFGSVALFYIFTLYFSSVQAALLTAAMLLFLAFIVLLFVSLFGMRRQPYFYRLTRSNNPVEEIIQDAVTPALCDWVKRYPGRSMAMTLLAGMIVGSNKDSRYLFKKHFDRYF